VLSLRDLAVTRFTQALESEASLPDVIAAIRSIDDHVPDNTLWAIVVPFITANTDALLGDNDFFEMVQEMPELNRMMLLSKGGKL
ncbi:hypothetical protein LTR53_020525, partial [Teratosphaeriaceae sp. CCFEE 6253]